MHYSYRESLLRLTNYVIPVRYLVTVVQVSKRSHQFQPQIADRLGMDRPTLVFSELVFKIVSLSQTEVFFSVVFPNNSLRNENLPKVSANAGLFSNISSKTVVFEIRSLSIFERLAFREDI